MSSKTAIASNGVEGLRSREPLECAESSLGGYSMQHLLLILLRIADLLFKHRVLK